MKDRNWIKTLLVVIILFTFGLLFASPQPQPLQAAGSQQPPPSHILSGDLEAARERVEALGAYQLTADIQQNLVPRPLVGVN